MVSTERYAKVVLNISGIINIIKKQYTARAASDKSTPWEVLVFTLLSARTRDEQTEIVFQRLMKKYPTVVALAGAQVSDVEQILKNIGLYKNKSRAVIALAKKVHVEYHDEVPCDMDSLIDLPGVGRKTASCVLVYAFRQPAIAVDTHVHRVTNRLGWVKTKNPQKTEIALRKILPKQYWLDINRIMVQFGRTVCVPRAPRCGICPVRSLCQFPRKTL